MKIYAQLGDRLRRILKSINDEFYFFKNGDEFLKTSSVNNDRNIFQNYDIESKQLILSTVLKAYDVECQRTRDIENKAINTVGFVGVIFSLTIMTLSSIITSTDEVTRTKILFSSICSPIMIFIILLFMFLSILFGLYVLFVKNWWFLLVDNFLNECNNEDKSGDELVKMMLDGYEEGIKQNDGTNTKIASYLKNAQILFLLSLIIVIIYFIYILNLVY